MERKIEILSMKKVVVSIVVLLICLGSNAQDQMLVDKVIARVGSEFITLSDIEEEFQYAKTADPNISEETKCDFLKSAIAQKVLIYQAKIDSVEVSDEEVEAQLDYRFQSVLNQMNGDEAFFQEQKVLQTSHVVAQE